MHDPGRWAREEGRRVRRELFLRSLRRDPFTLLLALLLLVAAFSVVPLVVGYFGFRDLGWAGVGAAVATAVWVIYLIFERESGASSRFVGADAEVSTAEEFAKLDAHHIVHGLDFDGRDVDHVVVGPSGIFAIETKWCGWQVFDEQGRPTDTFRKFVASARWAAGRIDALVRKAARIQVEVQPVLVLWGPAAPRDGREAFDADGVMVLVGREGPRWRRLFETSRLDSQVVEEAMTTLLAQREKQQRAISGHRLKLTPWGR